jgi:hypothetical protein
MAEFDAGARPLEVRRGTSGSGGQSRHGLSCRSLENSAIAMTPLLAVQPRPRNAKQRPRHRLRVIPRKPWLLCGEVDGKISRPAAVISRAGRAAAGDCDSFGKRIDSRDGVAYITRTGGVGALAADVAWNFGTMSRRAPPC